MQEGEHACNKPVECPTRPPVATPEEMIEALQQQEPVFDIIDRVFTAACYYDFDDNMTGHQAEGFIVQCLLDTGVNEFVHYPAFTRTKACDATLCYMCLPLANPRQDILKAVNQVEQFAECMHVDATSRVRAKAWEAIHRITATLGDVAQSVEASNCGELAAMVRGVSKASLEAVKNAVDAYTETKINEMGETQQVSEMQPFVDELERVAAQTIQTSKKMTLAGIEEAACWLDKLAAQLKVAMDTVTSKAWKYNIVTRRFVLELFQQYIAASDCDHRLVTCIQELAPRVYGLLHSSVLTSDIDAVSVEWVDEAEACAACMVLPVPLEPSELQWLNIRTCQTSCLGKRAAPAPSTKTGKATKVSKKMIDIPQDTSFATATPGELADATAEATPEATPAAGDAEELLMYFMDEIDSVTP